MNKIKEFAFIICAGWSLTISCSSEDPAITSELNQLNITEDLRILADHEDVLIGNFSGLTVDKKGIIYVADSQLQKIHLFSPGGEYIESIGREGRGPGDFVRMDAHLRILSDTLYVKDNNTHRISLFNLNSRQLIRTLNIPDAELDNIPMGRSRDIFPMPDGTLLVSFLNPYIHSPEESAERHKITISRIDNSGEFVEKNILQLPVLFPTNQMVVLLSSNAINIMSGLSFYPDTRMGIDPDGNLFIGNTDSLSIWQYHDNGNKAAALEGTPPVIALTTAHLDSISDSRGLNNLDEVFNKAGRPENWPAYEYFLFDDRGRCWIKLKQPGKPEQTWWVFDENKELKWNFQLPEEINLY
ncbi:MAG: 6-bladed beta-propeller, partial [Balneolales bacterium]